MDEIDAYGVGAGQAVGSSAVEVGCWWGRRERKSVLPLDEPFAVFQQVGVVGEEL